MWHSLDNNDNISVYDVEWSDGLIETNIPARMLESVKEHKHKKEGHQSEDTPLKERKYKSENHKKTAL